ncbi:sir2 family histone [Paraphaeosphaeria sporulosa]
MSEADDNDDFARLAGLLRKSPRIVCIVGAGLSAPSGLATWRGTNGLWNDNDIRSLASPKRFAEDPVTVWSFYGERLLKSLAAQPNAAHHALAALASWHDGWLTVNQNVDGLLERTRHPVSRLLGIHGALQLVRCTGCDYNIYVRTLEDLPFLGSLSTASNRSQFALSDLPHCPECTKLLRPGVVWFGERLADGAPDNVESLLEDGIDLVIAAGTSLKVHPAAEWVYRAQADGASIAIIDLDQNHQMVDTGDLFFKQDITIVLPKVLNHLQRQWNIRI